MTRSQELFELLARRARAREAEKAAAPVAEKPARRPKIQKGPTITKGDSPPSPPPERSRAERRRSEAHREPLVVAAAAAEPRIAAPGAIVLSRRGAALLGVATTVLVAVAFFAGERVGRSGGLGSPPISTLTTGVADSDVEPAATGTAPPEAPPASGETWGVRVVTYEFNPPNAERASEVLEHLRAQGFRDVDARQAKNGTELRIYAGRYSRQDDPALVSMRDQVRSLPGPAKAGKKDALPFASAYIMRRGD